MSWNYRVIKTVTEVPGWEPEEQFAIHEVYYFEDNDDHPRSYTVDPVDVSGESIEGLAWALGQMRAALEKPVMTAADFPELADDEPEASAAPENGETI